MKRIAISLLAVVSVFTISCEIGLGSSVDTDPPAIEITTPPVDAIIRDAFAIAIIVTHLIHPFANITYSN